MCKIASRSYVLLYDNLSMIRIKKFSEQLIKIRNVHLKCDLHRSVQTKSVVDLLDISRMDNNLNQNVRVVGWLKSFRDQKEIKFIHLNDGSDNRNLQLVIQMEKFANRIDEFNKKLSHLHLNTSIEVNGRLVKSTHKSQPVELQVDDLNIIGTCDPTSYPFKLRAKYDLEQLRSYIHLRAHSNTFANILRFRSNLTLAFHEFFAEHKFTQIHTPIITSNNCEGGCQTFSLQQMNSETANEAKISSGKENKDENEKHFFFKPVYLTASAQLHLETMTSTLGKVYTLSPTFRAEKSLSRHHLAEFYMLEAELIDLERLEPILDFVEQMIKAVSLRVLSQSNQNDLETINKLSQHNKKTVAKSAEHSEFLKELFQNRKFVRVTYQQALDILNENSLIKKASQQKQIRFGEDLSKEQEKLLVEHFNQTPVFITNYPRSLKPFYMRRNQERSDLVDNFDLLVPNVGEIVGGSLREHNYKLLLEAMEEQGLNLHDYKEYLETKKYGAMKMGGFGLGLERFVQFLLNIQNIKDTCAFPRSLHNCKM